MDYSGYIALENHFIGLDAMKQPFDNVLHKSLFVVFFRFWPLHCLSFFDLRRLITHLQIETFHTKSY
jgi:hypothetical protein